jgi:hypothetical protein
MFDLPAFADQGELGSVPTGTRESFNSGKVPGDELATANTPQTLLASAF